MSTDNARKGWRGWILNTWICPRCGHICEPSWKYCPYCGCPRPVELPEVHWEPINTGTGSVSYE